jgi:hypothetical protein
MNKKMRQLADLSLEKFTSLENRLSGVLKPIKPRKEFVHGVASHIQSGTRTTIVDRIADWHFVAILIAGILSLSVFVIIIGRVMGILLKNKRSI